MNISLPDKIGDLYKTYVKQISGMKVGYLMISKDCADDLHIDDGDLCMFEFKFISSGIKVGPITAKIAKYSGRGGLYHFEYDSKYGAIGKVYARVKKIDILSWFDDNAAVPLLCEPPEDVAPELELTDEEIVYSRFDEPPLSEDPPAEAVLRPEFHEDLEDVAATSADDGAAATEKFEEVISSVDKGARRKYRKHDQLRSSILEFLQKNKQGRAATMAKALNVSIFDVQAVLPTLLKNGKIRMAEGSKKWNVIYILSPEYTGSSACEVCL